MSIRATSPADRNLTRFTVLAVVCERTEFRRCSVVLGGVCCELLLANGCFVGTVEDGMPVGGMLSVVNFIIIAQLLFVLLTYVTEVG